MGMCTTLLDVATCELPVLVEHVLEVAASRAARKSAHEELIVTHFLPSKREETSCQLGHGRQCSASDCLVAGTIIGYKVLGARYGTRYGACASPVFARDLQTAACAKCKDALQSSTLQVGTAPWPAMSVHVISCRLL